SPFHSSSSSRTWVRTVSGSAAGPALKLKARDMVFPGCGRRLARGLRGVQTAQKGRFRVCWGALEQALEFVRGQRLGEPVALAVGAAQFEQQRALLVGLDALGGQQQAQV